MSHRTRREATVSIRLLWPFFRLIGADPRVAGLMADAGLAPAVLGNPEARLPHAFVMGLLARAEGLLGDPCLGLRAGQLVDQGDLDVLEYAARSAPNLGEALRVMARYLRIMHEAAEVDISVEGDVAIWRVWMKDGIVVPPAANDYAIAMSLAFSARNVTVYEPPVEIRLAHDEPSYSTEYARYFGTTVRFGFPDNAIVLRKARLAIPMLRHNPEMGTAFEIQASRMADKLREETGLVARVRSEAAEQFRAGSVSMEKTARRIGMGTATLRRRLDEEGATFTGIVDELRREMAERHLASAEPTVSEVAFLLGFSDVRAFGRAFRRWTGLSPTEFRSTQTPKKGH